MSGSDSESRSPCPLLGTTMKHNTLAKKLIDMSRMHKRRVGILEACVQDAWDNVKADLTKTARLGNRYCYLRLQFGGMHGANEEYVKRVIKKIKDLAAEEDIILQISGPYQTVPRLHASTPPGNNMRRTKLEPIVDQLLEYREKYFKGDEHTDALIKEAWLWAVAAMRTAAKKGKLTCTYTVRSLNDDQRPIVVAGLIRKAAQENIRMVADKISLTTKSTPIDISWPLNSLNPGK